MKHLTRRLGSILAVTLTISIPLFSQTKSDDGPSFEVATIRPTPPDDRSGRFTRMQSTHQFQAKSYTLKYMIAAAYNLPVAAVFGGPSWSDSDPYDIVALTPGEKQPSLDEQMSMLRNLLLDRFKLAIHREPKELSIYTINIGKGGMKLKESSAPSTAQPVLVNSVFPDHIFLPARNATMGQFASMLQRAVLDRPVVDKTGLSGRYDFDLEWTADESQFGGRLPRPAPDAPRKADLFTAVQEQLGLKLEATKGPVQVIVIESVQKPSDN